MPCVQQAQACAHRSRARAPLNACILHATTKVRGASASGGLPDLRL